MKNGHRRGRSRRRTGWHQAAAANRACQHLLPNGGAPAPAERQKLVTAQALSPGEEPA